jgi:hypothetical protein
MKYIYFLLLMAFAANANAQQGYSVCGGTATGGSFEAGHGAGFASFSGATAQVFPANQIPAGCTDPNACNYDPGMLADDGSCFYGNCAGVEGCTNPSAENYNPNASVDDGSCIVGGCTYPNASNYNPVATNDDGTCLFDDSCPTDFNNDGLTGVADLLFFISFYGTNCN